MKEQGWMISGQDADLGIYETASNDSLCKKMLTYDDAKEAAVNQLESLIQPYIERIAMLKADKFLVAGKLPKCKAWCRYYASKDQHFVVTAKSKKRAMEILRTGRSGFEQNWNECNGNWWYHLAIEEGAWFAKSDKANHKTRKFLPSLTCEEAKYAAELHSTEYRVLPIESLLELVGQKKIDVARSSRGTPYEVKIEFTHDDWEPNIVTVSIKIDDGLGWNGHDSLYIYREISQPDIMNPNHDGV